LSSTKPFDMCNPVARGEWLDILIALIEYLRSGTSKVGYLNNSLENNRLDKDQDYDDRQESRDGWDEKVEEGNSVFVLC